jgi:large repetitive protein
VTVNVSPTLTAVNNQTVCTGAQTTAVAFADNLTGTTYAWTNNTASIGLAASGTGNIAAFTATNTGTAPVTATISFTGSNSGCTSAPTTFTISVNPTPTVAAITDQAVCAGATNPAVVPTGAVTGTNYDWTNTNTAIGLAASGTGIIPSFTAVNAGATALTSTVTVTPSYGGNMGTVFGATNENGSLVLNAPAGTFFTGVQFASWGTPTGTLGNYAIGTCHAANSSTVVSNLAVGQTTVTIPATIAVFGDPCGGVGKALAVVLTYGTNGTACAGTPETYTITVNPTPVVANITTTICSGTAFTAAPSGSDVVPAGTTYTWTVAQNANVTGASNQTTASATISQTLTNTTNTAQIVVYTVAPISGTCSGATFTVTVTVNPSPFVTPQTTIVCSATAFSVSPTNGSGNIVPTGTTYTWSAPTVTGITGTASGSSASNISGTLVNTTNAPINVTYTVTPTAPFAPAIGSTYGGGIVAYILQPSDAGYVAGQMTALIAAPNDLASTAWWGCYGLTIPSTPNGLGQGITATNNIVNAITANVSCPQTGYAALGAYNASINTFSDWFLPNQAEMVKIYQNILQVSGVQATRYWTSSQYNNANAYYYDFSNGTSNGFGKGNYYPVRPMRLATVNLGCTGTSFTVTVTVNPTPAVSNMTATICSATAFTAAPVNVTNGVVPTGTTYTWTVAANANVTGETAVATASNNISQTLTNTTVNAEIVSYTVTPTANTCDGATFTVAVTVSPIPVIANKTAVMCSGTAFTVAPVNGTDLVPTGTTYTWTVAANANVNGETAQTTPVSSISQVLNNTTNTIQTVVYTVTPSFGGCTGATFTVSVTVNPTPSIITQVTNACSGVAFTLSPTNGAGNIVPNGTTYTWTVVDNPNVVGETNANVAQSNVSQTLVNNYTSSQQIVYTVTPTAGSCIGIPFTYTVTLSTPVSVAAITGATNVCLGSTTQLASATSGGAWTSTNTAVATVSSTGVVTGITTGTTTISYTVTNSVGCIGVVSATINVNTLPTAVITPSGSTTLCDGGSVTLTASTGSSYLWSNGLQTQSITVGNAGNYSVIVTNAAGCSTTSAPVAVIVNALPSATISANGPTTFCQGGSVTLTASSGTSYAWSNGATTSSITVNTSGNYSVTITNANGCSATSASVAVTVNTLPIANITSLNGNTFCQGGSVTLVSSAGSSYAWSNGLTTQSINVTTSANLTVTVTNANGCSATSAPFGVTMNAAPVATITANGPTTFCQGGQVTLTAPAAAAYQWNSGETTQSIVVNVDGPSTVTITNANGCSATSAITNITVLPIPTVDATAGSNQLCVGSTINLTNATIGGVWTSTNTTVATVSATGEITALSAGTSTINYAVTNASGCTTTSSMTLNVNALPSVLAIAGANSLCVGSQVAYTNGVTGGTWSSNNVGIATVAQNGVITGVATGTATISYTITNAAGCSSTVTKVVTVNALPTVTVVANGPLTFCQGGSVTLTASGGTSYAWSNSTITTPARTITTSGTYTVTATNANGCFATSTPVVVNVLALPNAAIASTGSNICLGSTTTLTASGGVSYAWSNGAQTASTTVNNSNTYTVTVTGANGCTATASNVVTVNANPAVVVTASAPLTFCQGGSVTLNATGAATYIWSNGTLGSSNVITQSGTYYAQGTNAAGCTSNSAVFTVTVLPTPVVAALTGSNTVCEASTINLSSATPGGVWATSNSFIANVDNAGVITGMTAGTAVITYTLSNGACNASVSASVTVLNSPATPVITAGGPTTVCPNETVQLFSSNAPNYQWNSGPQTDNILVTQSGSYTVTVVGSNGCAVTSLPMTVTIGDDVAPIIVAPINVNVNPNLGCTAVGVALGTPVVSDNCTVASVTNNAPSLFPIGTTTVTWTVTDASGNTATATQLVNVVDQVAPEATAPADVTVNTNNFCDATGVNLGTPEATDNCTIASIANDAPASFPIGTTVVTWTITDATGNFTTVTQNVTVTDTEAPVVVLQSAAVQLDANGFGVLSFEAIDNGSYDNCGIATVSIDQTTFDCSQVGFNTVTVTITDNSGNQSVGTVVINVIASDACGSDNIAGPNVPDAFTPNGNSINDTWVIPGLEGYNTKQMAVYSRYGTLVYYSAAYANDWDGTLIGNGVAVPDGTYYYILNLDGGKQMAGYVYINRVKQ